MIEVRKYSSIPDFFRGFLEEMDMKPSELARKLGKSHTAISLIINGKRNAGNPLLQNMCDLFNLDFNQLLELKESTNKKKEGNAQEEDINREEKNLSKEQVVSGKDRLQRLLEDNPEALALLEIIDSMGSYQEKGKLIKDLRETAHTRIASIVQKYSHRELKKKLIEISDYWTSLANLPKYQAAVNQVPFKCDLEGILELSDTSLYFSLTADEKSICLSVQHKDRHYMQEQIKLMPGIIVTHSVTGSVGKILTNIPIFHFRVFNLAAIAVEMKIAFSNVGISLNSVSFEECNIDTYFKKSS